MPKDYPAQTGREVLRVCTIKLCWRDSERSNQIPEGCPVVFVSTLITISKSLPLLVVDAVLVLVQAGGDQISLPAHWRVFRTNPGPGTG